MYTETLSYSFSSSWFVASSLKGSLTSNSLTFLANSRICRDSLLYLKENPYLLVKNSSSIISFFYNSNTLLLYFLGYKTDFFSFQNNPKDLDPSYKTDLDLWDC